jgi:hypothetical protein
MSNIEVMIRNTQIPNSKSQIIFNYQAPINKAFGILEIGIYLDVGAWNLGFLLGV